MSAETEDPAALEIFLEEEFDRLYERLKREEEQADAVEWGGFFRRAAAFSVDLAVLTGLSALLFYLAYVGYSVGLAAHHQTLSEENLDALLLSVFLGWFFLVAGYFVLLHGMGGRTVGKVMFGLRVVGPDHGPIGYGRALLRCIGTPLAAVSGLGVLWIFFSREKRGWHDFLAGTWVIRE